MSDLEARWRAQVAWMNSTFEFYFKCQEGLGFTREEAVARLKRTWAREDAERLRGVSEAAGRVSRAG